MVLLSAGFVSIVAALWREAWLEPGEAPGSRARRRGRIAGGIATGVVITVVVSRQLVVDRRGVELRALRLQTAGSIDGGGA